MMERHGYAVPSWMPHQFLRLRKLSIGVQMQMNVNNPIILNSVKNLIYQSWYNRRLTTCDVDSVDSHASILQALDYSQQLWYVERCVYVWSTCITAKQAPCIAPFCDLDKRFTKGAMGSARNVPNLQSKPFTDMDFPLKSINIFSRLMLFDEFYFLFLAVEVHLASVSRIYRQSIIG